MSGKIVNVDKKYRTRYNNNESFNEEILSLINSSSSINDLTVGNNEAIIATFLNYTRMIGQQARSYDMGINTLAHEFALVTTSIFADAFIQVKLKYAKRRKSHKRKYMLVK